MVDMREIYKEQLHYVKAIAEDVLKHNGSKEILEYAAGYASVEAPFEFKGNEDMHRDNIRINWGEAYCYIDIDEDGNVINELSWLNDEMGIDSPDCNYYRDSIEALNNMKIGEAYDGSEYSPDYDDETDYHLVYQPMQCNENNNRKEINDMNKNELYVSDCYIYFQTKGQTFDDAMDEFLKVCDDAGLEITVGKAELRNADGEDIE